MPGIMDQRRFACRCKCLLKWEVDLSSRLCTRLYTSMPHTDLTVELLVRTTMTSRYASSSANILCNSVLLAFSKRSYSWISCSSSSHLRDSLFCISSWCRTSSYLRSRASRLARVFITERLVSCHHLMLPGPPSLCCTDPAGGDRAAMGAAFMSICLSLQ